MKKIMLLCVAMAAMFVSCSKDYDSMIIGTWECESILEKKVSTEGVVTEEECQNNSGEMTFNNDGTCYGSWFGLSITMVNSRGEVITVETSCPWNHYLIEDNKLIMIDDRNIRSPFTIKSMSSSKCILTVKYENIEVSNYESPEPGPMYSLIQVTYSLKKK